MAGLRTASTLLGLLLPALAAAQTIAQSAAALMPQQPAPLSLQGRLSAEPQQPALLNLEQGLWAHRGRLSLGLQARLQTWRPDPEGLPQQPWATNPPSLHMGVAMTLHPQARLELSTPLESDAALDAMPRPQGLRLALELRPSSNPAAQLRSGLRLELDSRSRLTLRPRGGGLALYYHSSF
ncbi:hypothetical protein G8A07_22365 [Roseateles sp. DAIF2]|uniref:hypothetical protein n=1 Tax=Roseateles sp. DAIF2 TaxID=2714952 RepID=UPI0018A28D21|nr:hypothetical protein [Roseateles sp. DAIF2]QPF75392.1 hypothetical protein G8A07_22365 [Roseateles sp. DAIF2]